MNNRSSGMTAPDAAELQGRLDRIKAFVTDPERMKDWDAWRHYIAGGGGSSWPRDAYECILDWVAEECDGNE